MAPKYKFADGEKVLCFHGPLLYEAKCIKAQVKDKNIKYYIHYSGWNKNWDEWVPESRVLKYNDAATMKQKELLILHSNSKKGKPTKANSKKEPTDRETTVLPPQDKTPKAKRKEEAAPTPTAIVSESPADVQRKKRRAVEQNIETEDEYLQKMEIKIKLPDELKHWVVDDWDLITKQKKLFKLPARIPVETILQDYMDHKISIKGITKAKEAAILETINGIREYFNVMLGKQLLFKCERAQYLEIMSQNPDSTPARLYGGFHLLRMFTKIGGALAYTQLDEDSVSFLTTNIFEILKYLSKCASTILSLSDYDSEPQDKKTTGSQQVKEEKSGKLKTEVKEEKTGKVKTEVKNGVKEEKTGKVKTEAKNGSKDEKTGKLKRDVKSEVSEMPEKKKMKMDIKNEEGK